MRALVLALALLAAAKIWVQDSFYRFATEEALVSAYRARAAIACASLAPASTASASDPDWATRAEPRLSVGNPALRVHLWQFDHEQWNARFRQPYLVLSAGNPGVACTYDILAGTAEISRS